MTKLEAWKSWCATAGTDRMADEFTLENSSHGKAFSFAWDAAHEACAKVCDLRARSYSMETDMWAHEHVSEAKICAAAIRARGQA